MSTGARPTDRPTDPAGAAPAGPPTEPPAERYGRSRDRVPVAGRVLAIGLVVLLAATLAAVVYYVYRSQTQPDISGTQSGFEVPDDHTATTRLDVTRDDPATPVFCIVRAKEYSGAEVGRREVFVPPSDQHTVRMDTAISTTARAVTTDVYGCGADVPTYLRR